MKPPLRIRQAREDDLDSLLALAERTFRETFSAENEPANMETYLHDAFSIENVRAELADRTNVFLLAFADDTVEPMGYAKLRAGKPNASVSGPDPVEIERIYVERSAIGRGVGAALMQASLDEAASRGHRAVWLGVWELNRRAIHFYRRWGFETVGSRVFRLGADDQIDLVMERPVVGFD